MVKGPTTALSSVFGDSKQELIKQQDRRLHLRALCILTALVQSMVKWNLEHHEETSIGVNHPDEDHGEMNPVIGKNPIMALSMKVEKKE